MGNASSIEEPPAEILLLVLSHLRHDWAARSSLLQTCRGWSRHAKAETTWRLLCCCLGDENALALPCSPPTCWREHFRHCLTLTRTRTQPGEETHSLLATVFVRFRPPGLDGVDGRFQSTAVMVPLHQRLQALRVRHGCSRDDAARLLFGTSVAQDPWLEAGCDEPLPCAPAVSSLSPLPSTSASTSALEAAPPSASAAVLSCGADSVLCLVPGAGLRSFRFQRVFDAEASAAAVYSAAADPSVCGWLNGQSAVLLAYGPTGSGKTHTLHGASESISCDVGGAAPHPDAGIAPRACHAAMVELARRRELHARGVCAVPPQELWCSYVQVYGDEVTDLLASGVAVGAWAGVAAAALSAGHAEVRVSDADAMSALLLAAERAKKRAATAMNARSSRAHSLLTLRLRPCDGNDAAPTPRLVIADLGGCERVKRSGADADPTRLQEAIHINLGLLALQHCIAALAEKAQHVPFGDSRLTSLLAGALHSAARDGGALVFLVAARTDPCHAPETLRALRFGEAAARAALTHQAGGSAAPGAAAAMAAIDAELHSVEAAIALAERCDKGKPVGAEALRSRQESLVAARRALCGQAGEETQHDWEDALNHS